MKIVLAPNALKGSLSAHSAAEAMEHGVKRADPKAEVVLKPVADGGDGFAEVLAEAVHADKIAISVTGPLGNSINSAIYYSNPNSLAIIEMATIAGLTLVSLNNRNPLLTTTFGVGEAIRTALDAGAKRIIIGIGGSATNDAGIGMATALGAKFFNSEGETVQPVGGSLEEIVGIDISGMDRRLANVKIDVACDVDNPFYGEMGAAHIFAPQKGANPEQVTKLDKGLRQFAALVNEKLGVELSNLPGAGAAGGLGGALLAFCNAELSRGIDIVLDTLEFNEALENATLVLTAEGQLDDQTDHGKAPAGVAKRAHQYNIPCIALAGSVNTQLATLDQSHITAAFSICPGSVSLKQSMENAFEYLSNTTEQVIRNFLAAAEISNKKTENTPEDQKMIRKCLFPAAGYGTRFLPATKAMPKEILPILNKPLIQYGVEEALDGGLNQIAIITGRGKRALEDHFDISYELEHQIIGTSKENHLSDIRRIIEECTFSYTRQIEMKGLGHAILVGETLIGDEPFGVILADDLCVGEGEGVMSQMLKIYEKYRCSVLAIQEVAEAEVHKYGVIEGRQLDEGLYMVSDMVEKPDAQDAPSNLAIIGRYVLTPDIFDILRHTQPGKNGELQITDALKIQAEKGMVLAYKFNGMRFDCGSVDGFVSATNYFYETTKES